MKHLITACLIVFGIGHSFAQSYSVGCDVLNRYVWRRLDLGGNSASLQPTAGVTFGTEKHALTVGTWSAFSLANTANSEVDLLSPV